MKRSHHLLALFLRTASGGPPLAGGRHIWRGRAGLSSGSRRGVRPTGGKGVGIPRFQPNLPTEGRGTKQPMAQATQFRTNPSRAVSSQATACRVIPPRRTGSAGFTLLEILVVIAILGLLIGLVAPAALRQLSGARASVVKQSIERISSVLDLYKLDVGSYPSTEQGLAALVQKPSGAGNWNGPYLKGEGVPMDPWNHPYMYRSPSERTGREFDLCSMGPNANAGASGMICNP
jgi:general secretion pathway protein G